MLKRTITGAFILLGVALFIFLKQFSNLIFDAFLLVIMYCSLVETVRVYNKDNKHIDYLIFIVPAVLCAIFNLESNTFRALGFVLLFAILFVLYLLSVEIVNYAIKRKNGTNEKDVEVLNKTLFDGAKYSMQVFAYPTIVISMLMALNHLSYEVSYMGIILAFAISMMTDTFAYLFGRSFGKRKFIPEVSPNKTIAGMIGGFVGGIVASIVCLIIYSKVSGFDTIIEASKELYILVFSCIGVLGAWADQLGDLVASALKRKVGVKDYAHIFPGHGGFMDRIDGLMFTSALIYIVFALFLV